MKKGERKNVRRNILIIVILSIILVCIFVILWQILKKEKIENLYSLKKYEEAYSITQKWFLFKDNDLYDKVKIMEKITKDYEEGKEYLKKYDKASEDSKGMYKSLAKTDLLSAITKAIAYEEVLDKLNIRDEVITIRNDSAYIYLKELQLDLEKALNDKYDFEFAPLGTQNEDKLKEVIAEVVKVAKDTEIKDEFKRYISQNNVKLTAKEVQYNIKNNLDKEFTLEGIANLDDYYNYGYNSNIEDSYFCIRVSPSGSTYSDNWYIYCSRYKYKELYSKLLKGKQYLKLVCKIPKYKFEKNQGNMATAIFIKME